MTLPTFLGIGAMRAGTTWLHELLASHPDVYVPWRRKEVFFFNLYYNRGLAWYEDFFPSDEEAYRYRAIGEISPTYLYDPYCPQRIAELRSVTQLITMLRHPTDNLYSLYGLLRQEGKFSGSFESFLSQPQGRDKFVLYSRHLRNYLQQFSREQLLVLIFEEAVSNPSQTKVSLANFLGVQVARFPAETGEKKTNASYVPKFPKLHELAGDIGVHLYRRDMDWVVRLAHRLGLVRMFRRGKPFPPMDPQTRSFLNKRYQDEIDELEALLDLDFGCWKPVG